MLYVGLDLSRKRLDWQALAVDGERVGEGACPPDRDGLAHLVEDFDREQGPVLAAIESMTGARYVHDQLELAGWDVRIADAQRAKGIAPLACKTDRIDAWVLAELARRDLVPEIWLPGPEVRGERERARFRLYLVHKRTSLKNRVHAILFHAAPARARRSAARAHRSGRDSPSSSSATARAAGNARGSAGRRRRTGRRPARSGRAGRGSHGGRPVGTRVQLVERLAELARRYDTDAPVGRAVRRSAAEFCAVVDEFEEIVASASPP